MVYFIVFPNVCYYNFYVRSITLEDITHALHIKIIDAIGSVSQADADIGPKKLYRTRLIKID